MEYSPINLIISAIIVIVLFYLYKKYYCNNNNNINNKIEKFEDAPKNIINPTYLNSNKTKVDPSKDLKYTSEVIEKQSEEIKKLRKKVVSLTEKIEEGLEPTEIVYRRKLSNKNYPIVPVLNEVDKYLNLYDDDFSNKTLSTVQFLSQTKPSKFYGSDVHFTSELCDNYCETQDKNVISNPNIETPRPLAQNDATKLKRK